MVVRDPELGLDYSRVVHGEQRFEYARPIVAGDELVVTITIETIRTMAGNDMITTRGDIATVHGEHVVTTTSLLVSRGPEGSDHDRAPCAGPTSRSAPSCPRRPSTSIGPRSCSYAGASGDFNVIHWNERVATEVGLPNVIAHGMLTMALGGRVVTDWVGDPGALLEYGVRFTRPVVVPDDDAGATIEVTGEGHLARRRLDGGR